MTLPAEQLNAALAQTARAIERDAPGAIRMAREILAAAPGHPRARLYLGAALRRNGEAAEAEAVLGPLAQEQPDLALVWFELGLLRGSRGETAAAIAALTR
ncbi:MAG TPA: tetratricopeptide repeat protein, partial [Rhizomicrobium sp.]|nr:tetratricopeptide repeat protein [Rhizomicrobium sp.]